MQSAPFFKIGCLALVALGLLACGHLGKARLRMLHEEVEAYHRDLLFERYEIAAKKLSPAHRSAFLKQIQTQGLRYAEIEIQNVESCQKDADDCAYVHTQMQWYTQEQVKLQQSKILEVWRYDKEENEWRLNEQRHH